MATITAFDNVNQLGNAEKRRSMPYEQYFGEMELTEEQKRRRIALAEDLEDAVLFLFALYLLALEHEQEIQLAVAEREYKALLEETIKRHNIQTAVILMYLEDVASEEARVTARRFRDNEYWLSYDRAMEIAENDANILWNSEEYQDAVKSGATMKRWVTMKDFRVRPTHREVDNIEIPIDEPFVVGDSLLMFPGDTSLGASVDEIANCRCSISYI